MNAPSQETIQAASAIVCVAAFYFHHAFGKHVIEYDNGCLEVMDF